MSNNNEKKLVQKIVRISSLIVRPFIDFYYNYGLNRASVLSYILCANLIMFVYLFMTIGVTITLDPLVSPNATRRFLELHFLWPTAEKLLIKKAPPNFGLPVGDLLTTEKFEKILKNYCQRNELDRAALIEKGDLQIDKFSITTQLGSNIYEAIRTFYDEKEKTKINPLGAGFFIILAIAYFALSLSIKTNLAESVSPLVWGNLPVAHRRSEIMKILWRIPAPKALKTRVYLFFMLPILVTITITILSAGHKFFDLFLERYSTGNIIVTVTFSLFITTCLFTALYELHVTGISKRNAAIGAFIAASLWLGGRWLFTTFSAVSLYRNLRNFAIIPIFLTWFYYFCTVFLFGLYVAHTIQNPNFSSTARSWAMKDIYLTDRYAILSKWIRLDFLCRLASNRYEEFPPPFIGTKVEYDCAADIARKSNLPPTFVRECILTMIVRHRKIFHIEVEGNRQYCKLKNPPEETEVMSLLVDSEDIESMKSEMQEYNFATFITKNYGYFWNSPAVMLSQVYQDYKLFLKHNKIK